MSPSVCPDCGRPLPAGAPGGLCPACLLKLGEDDPATTSKPENADSPDAAHSPDEEPTGRRIGRYKLLEIIGEGGFGTVWMAEQTEPVRRKVALKIIKLGMDTRQVVARFEAERQALALMDHPNIARVLDAGATEVGRPYFVMELVRGVPITDFCDARGLSTRERVELMIPVCQAVQHAHQKGVIHRDLKPSNILVTEQDGRAVPRVIDFGVAKAIEEPLTNKTLFTRFHQFLGTPAYMSPEQAGLGGLDVDTRTDIYSLGVLLYELLTGRPPLNARELRDVGHEALLKIIREVEPPKPSTRLSTLKWEDLTTVAARRREEPQRLPRLVRGDLDWIVLKALEKDRARRYETANGLAADLRRYLENEPIAARPPSSLYRFQKLARRNSLAVTAVGAVAIALVAGSITTWWQARRAERHLEQERLNVYISGMNAAHQAITLNDYASAVELLDRLRPGRDETDFRGFEWRHLWQRCQGNELEAFPNAGDDLNQCAVTFSPDGRFLVHVGAGRVVVRDARSRRPLTNLVVEAHTLSFSPDSQTLVTASRWTPGTVRFWNTASWEEQPSPRLTNATAPALFSPDGRWLITGTPDLSHYQLWSTRTWERVAGCPAHPTLAHLERSVVAFSADSRLLVTPWLDFPTQNGQVSVWKIPSLERVADLAPASHPLAAAAFLPGTDYLLTGSWMGRLFVWDLGTHPPALVGEQQEHTSTIPSISVAGGAKTFATASWDQSLCLWDASTFKPVARWRGHRREIFATAMSPDGELVASSSRDGSVRLWPSRPQKTGEELDDAGIGVGFISQGHTTVFGPSAGDYRWQLVTGTNRVVIPIEATPPLKFDFNLRPWAVKPGESVAALGRTDGQVELWDLLARKRSAVWHAGSNWIRAVDFSPNGQFLATGDDVGMVRIWDVTTLTETGSFHAMPSPIQALAFSPDGTRLATGSYSSKPTRVWNVARQEPVLFLDVTANEVVFAPDGRWLVVCSVQDNAARIFELPSGGPKPPLKGHLGGVVHASVSPDGRTLATTDYHGWIKLWNTATSQEVATIPHPGTANALRFSPDGRTLLASYWMWPGIRAQFLRAPRLEEIAAMETARQRLKP
jgi:WD40 repeat protein/serine/threonine protein kinase